MTGVEVNQLELVVSAGENDCQVQAMCEPSFLVNTASGAVIAWSGVTYYGSCLTDCSNNGVFD